MKFNIQYWFRKPLKFSDKGDGGQFGVLKEKLIGNKMKLIWT